jgi:hypothetical protein
MGLNTGTQITQIERLPVGRQGLTQIFLLRKNLDLIITELITANPFNLCHPCACITFADLWQNQER